MMDTNVMDVIVKNYVSCAFIKEDIRIIVMCTDDTFVLALKCATNKFHLHYMMYYTIPCIYL